jgi:hypothetical protein
MLNSNTNLKEAIFQLESQQAAQGKMLRAQLHLAYESIKPINLLKTTFKEVTASPELMDNIVNTSVGLATGYVSKAVFQNVSHSPFKKLLGTVLMFAMTNLVSKHPTTIKSLGMGAFNIIKYQLSKRLHSNSNNNNNHYQSHN